MLLNSKRRFFAVAALALATSYGGVCTFRAFADDQAKDQIMMKENMMKAKEMMKDPNAMMKMHDDMMRMMVMHQMSAMMANDPEFK